MTYCEKRKIALVHYWHVRRRGGERVLEVLADMFPHADIFIMFMDPASLAPTLRARKITTSFLQKVPGINQHYRKLLPIFPLALEQFQLDNYDLVISSEAGPAKGVLTRPGTLHICYCHTPLRYVWDKYHLYRSVAPWGKIGRMLYSLSAHYLRLWDFAAAARVDHFVASSINSKQRIQKYYRRDADVIYPPVDVASFEVGSQKSDFYLVVSPLVSYKRIELAIGACNSLHRRLVIIGQGEEHETLRAMAGPTVTFLGFQPDEVVREHYRTCRALIFPGEEDIGLTPIEAQASGSPVIAYGNGGALETVLGYHTGSNLRPDGSTGVFFREPTVDSLCEAVRCFEDQESHFSPTFIRSQVQRFSTSHFQSQFGKLIEKKMNQFDSQDGQAFSMDRSQADRGVDGTVPRKS